MPTTPISEKGVAELRELLTKATPGPWAEDDLWNNDSGTRYRDSRIIASNPLHPSHMDRTITICDTLNAWHCFSEEDREANMKLICALYNAAPALLALASQSQERDAELLSLRKDFEIVRTASRLFEQAAHDGLERALKAERATSEIRRAAIEECAKVAESPAWCEHTIGDGVIHAIARSIRAIAQQPTDGEVKTK